MHPALAKFERARRRLGYFRALLLLRKFLCAPARVQVAKNSATSGTTCSVTWGASTTTGNFLAAAVYAVRNTGGGLTPTPPATWSTVATAREGSTGSGRCCLFYLENAASQSSTGNFTSGATLGGMSVVVAEYSGVATASSLDQQQTNTGSSTTASTGTTGTTTQASELLLAALGAGSNDGNNTFASPTNSFLIYDQRNDGTSTSAVALLDRIVSSTSTYSTAATISNDFWAGVIGTFKAAAGASSKLFMQNLMNGIGAGGPFFHNPLNRWEGRSRRWIHTVEEDLLRLGDET